MYCPKCKVECNKKAIKNVLINICPECHGIWCDREELKKDLDTKNSIFIFWRLKLWKHQEKFRIFTKHLRCPKCDKEMTTCNYGDRDIEIDYCLGCKSIWVDKSEFEKIILTLYNEIVSRKFSPNLFISTALFEAKKRILSNRLFINGDIKSGYIADTILQVLNMFDYRFLSNRW